MQTLQSTLEWQRRAGRLDKQLIKVLRRPFIKALEASSRRRRRHHRVSNRGLVRRLGRERVAQGKDVLPLR